MKTLDEIMRVINQTREPLVTRYGVHVVGIYGSYVRGQQKEASDLDLIAEVDRPISLLQLVGAELFLSEAIGVKVDLIPRENLREELRERILREVVAV